MPTEAAAEIRDLHVTLKSSGLSVVSDVSLDLFRRELVGLVGESGSGKTTIGTAVLGYVRRGGEIAAGSVTLDDVDLLKLSASELRRYRGKVVSYVPQDPATALTPSMRISGQLSETLEVHEPGLGREERDVRIAAVLEQVGLPSDATFLRRFVHQLSGGQLQRIAIAMAFVTRPAVIVLDEPTTGLDVSTQALVLAMVKRLCRENDTAGLYVSHDLAVVAQIADRIAVAYAGRLVEMGTRDQVLNQPAHPYTRLLFASSPDIAKRRALAPIPGTALTLADRPPYCGFAPRCPFSRDECRQGQPEMREVDGGQFVRCVRYEELKPLAAWTPDAVVLPETAAATESEPILAVEGLNAWYGSHQILADVSMQVSPGECVAVVGQSGSGKTTLARCIVGAGATWDGVIAYDGSQLGQRPRERTPAQRREIQYIFQNPYGALNPRRSVREILTSQLGYLEGRASRHEQDRVDKALEQVALPASFSNRYPGELSGGERQRVGIARALICEPRLLICDEITSALDVSVQASIVNLLGEILRDADLAVLFITHNIALVRSIADRVLVMTDGRIVEEGPTATVLDAPREAYTQKLLEETPSLSDARSPGDGTRAQTPAN